MTTDPRHSDTLLLGHIMYLSKQHNVGVIDWAQTVHPGAPPSQHSNASAFPKPKISFQTTSNSSTSNSILTKSLTISEPVTAQGLYKHAPKTHPVPKHVVQQTSFEIVTESDDEGVAKIVNDEEGAILMEVENQSSNVEFVRAKGTPIKVKDKRGKKVCK